MYDSYITCIWLYMHMYGIVLYGGYMVSVPGDAAFAVPAPLRTSACLYNRYMDLIT